MADRTEASRELHTTVVTDPAREPGHLAPHSDPAALGLDATMWVALAMIVVIVGAIWKKVPAVVTGMLDKRIVAIREQLDRATTLRTEAEALRDEYKAKAVAADADADAIRSHAEAESAAILANAEVAATALIARRQAMAESKIAAAERTALADLRATAASAASQAAAQLIAERNDAAADRARVDLAISRLN